MIILCYTWYRKVKGMNRQETVNRLRELRYSNRQEARILFNKLQCIRKGKGYYRGFMVGIDSSIYLFDAPNKSTLCLFDNEVTIEAVKDKLRKHLDKY